MGWLKKIGIAFLALIVLGIIFGGSSDKPSAPTSIDNPAADVVSTPAQSQPQKSVVISYSAKKEDSIGKFGQPKEGKVFLIITMNIENKGYDKFNTNTFNFNLIANNIKYDVATESFSLDDKLDSVDLLDGGSTKGSIAFEVPSTVESYQLKYEGFGSYNLIYKTV